MKDGPGRVAFYKQSYGDSHQRAKFPKAAIVIYT